jgi:type II secretory pathway pseudopilin PulG
MSARDRTVLVIVCVVVAILAPWLLVVQPKQDQASKLQSQVDAEQSQLNSVRAQLAAGAAARAAFATSYTTLVRLGEAVPTDDNTPSLIYQLQAAATATGVDFQGLTFNAGSSGSSPAPAATGASAASLPPGASIGPAGFPIEPFTFTFQGNFFHLANFFGRLQRFVVTSNQHLSVSGRLMTLNSVSLAAGPKGFPQIAATISATTYLLPASQGLLSGATPAGPAPPTTQTVSTPGSSSPAPPAVVTPAVR